MNDTSTCDALSYSLSARSVNFDSECSLDSVDLSTDIRTSSIFDVDEDGGFLADFACQVGLRHLGRGSRCSDGLTAGN